MSTTEHSYTTMDKTDWGDGPWNDEPDKLQWIDEATGLDCLIVRNRLGALCGYVGVARDHPWHGRSYSGTEPSDMSIVPVEEFIAKTEDDYEASPESLIRVHGGLTFAGRCDDGAPEESGICHVPAPGRPADVWWFGFDCAHAGDIVPGLDARLATGFPPMHLADEVYRTVDYVRSECANLAKQLATVGLIDSPSEPNRP